MKILHKSFILIFVLILALSAAPQTARAQAATRIGVFEPVTVGLGQVVEAPVSVEGAEALYAVDIELRFDPALAQAEDADPASPGVQLGLAGFLDPGLVLYNEVDNQQGTAHFVMTQVNPSEPKSGSGILLVLYLKGIQAGESALTVSSVQLSDRGGIEIPSEGVNATLTVSTTGPAVKATAIPVANPTDVQWILGQTATAEPSAGVQQFIPMVGADPAGETAKETTWLGNYWWVLLVVGLAAVGLVIYRYRSR